MTDVSNLTATLIRPSVDRNSREALEDLRAPFERINARLSEYVDCHRAPYP